MTTQVAVVPTVFAAIAAAALVVSTTLSSTARLVPALAAAVVLALLAVEIYAMRRAARGRRHDGGEPPSDGREAAELLWVVSLPVLATIAGLVIGFPLFLFVYLRVRARLSPLSAAGPAFGCWFVLYVVLHRMLGVALP